MQIWAISNQKGGVGKTTTTVALGGLLAEAGKRVLLVDIDPQASLTCYFQVEPDKLEKSLYDCFVHHGTLGARDMLNIILPTAFERLSLMPSSSLLGMVERLGNKNLPAQQGKGLVLKGALALLHDNYDVVLIDSPPQLGILMVNTLAACQRLVIPVQTEYLALKGLERMLRTVQMVMTSLQRPAATSREILIMPTLYDSRTQTSQMCLSQLQHQYPNLIWPSVIPVDAQFRHASRLGVTPSRLAPHSRGVMAYRLLLSNLLEQPSMVKEVSHAE